MIPHLNELHKKYAPKGLVMIGVSTDEDAKTIADFRKKDKIDYTVALDKGLSEKLGVVTIPHAFLVTKDGKIVWQGSPIDLTAADLDKVVK
jgi:peroxiredoxin